MANKTTPGIHDLRGKIGIGTNNPGTLLQVGDGTSDESARVYHSDGTWTEVRGYGIQSNRSVVYLRPTGDKNAVLAIGANGRTWNYANIETNIFRVLTDDNEHFRINSAGQVGVGTTNPNEELEVKAAEFSTIAVNTDRNTSGENIGSFAFYGHNDATTPENMWYTRIMSSMTDVTDGSENGDIFFQQLNDGAGLETFRVKSSGEIQFPAYGAGYLRTDADGNVIVDISTVEDTLDTVTTRDPVTANEIQVGGITVSNTFPYVDFVDTNGFTDTNDRFRVRAYGDAGAIQWYDDSTSTVNGLMHFASTGDVGIGTTDPSFKLHVAGDILLEDSGTPIFRIKDSGNAGGGGAAGIIQFSNTDGNSIGIGYTGNDTTTSDLIISTNAGSTYGGYLGLDADAIDDPSSIILDPKTSVVINGDVGIGTTSPDAHLEISANAGADPSPITNPVTLRLTDAGSATSGQGDTTNPWAKIEFYSEDQSSGGPAVQAQISTIYDDIYSAGSHISFSNTATPTNGLSEKMRINSNGTIRFNSYGAGLLQTDASGNVSLDTNTYLTTGQAYQSIYERSWSSSSSAEYIKVEFPYIGGSGGSAYYVFDIIGYRDIGQMDSMVSYRAYIHLRSVGGVTNDAVFDLYTLNEGTGEEFTFSFKKIDSTSTEFYINIPEDYSGLEIMSVPVDAGSLSKVNPSWITNSTTAPTGVTSIVKLKYIANDSNGNVGIGTDSPDTTFHTLSSVNGINGIIENDTHNSIFQIKATDNAKNSEIWFGDAADDNVGKIDYDHSNNSMIFVTNANTAMTIDSARDVGIGETNPTSKLHIRHDANIPTGLLIQNLLDNNGTNDGDAAAQIFLNAASNNAYFRVHGAPTDSAAEHEVEFGTTAGDAFFTFKPSGNERMRITNGGNVGIGTDSPAGKLHLEGNFESGKALVIKGTYGTDTTHYIRTHGVNSEELAFYSGTAKPLAIDTSGRIKVNNAFYLPTADGSSGQVMTTDGNGTLTWSNVSGSSSDTLDDVTDNGNSTTNSIILGDSTTNGTMLVRGSYASGNIVVIGGMKSSGGAMIGYAVKPDTATNHGFVSSSSYTLERAAYYQQGNRHRWYGGASQNAAIGNAVTMSEMMTLNYEKLGLSNTSPATLLHLGNSTNGANIITFGEAGIGGPHGLDFYGDDATRTLKYSIYYRTGPENISMETSDGTKRFEITQSGAVTFNEAFTFPTADGSAGAALVTNGSGSLSWNAGYKQYSPVGWQVLNNQTYTASSQNISSNSSQVLNGTTPVQRNSATEFQATQQGWYEIKYSFIVKNNYANRAMIGAYMGFSFGSGGGVISGSHSTEYVRYSTYGEYAQIQNSFFFYAPDAITKFYLYTYLLSGSMNMTTQALTQSMISFRYINNDIT